MTTRSPRRNGGFTLIEIIVTIVILAFVATMVATYMTSAVANSALPVNRVINRGSAQGIMEAVSADYRQLMLQNSSNLGKALSDLKANIEEGTYSSYSGAYTGAAQYITFDTNGAEQSASGTSPILKVTITVGDQTVVALFSR
ncbi:prepilin-type N-terminal cleavage/methylation domain-containing protein [Desulfobaculum sp. SPO524]|uniref:type IV pilus modification PilV family protein n=1 Tax=Desulfobaculum sp. SPO524 TaxID=3378071 RepID=UPI003853D920